METAAITAVLERPRTVKGPMTSWRVRGNFLQCRLPSGRVLSYCKPFVYQKETPWGEMRPALGYYGINDKYQWATLDTYGGKLIENVCQAICRDLLAEAMLRLEAAGYPIVLHVHDEIIAETLRRFGSLEEFNEIMSEVPEWAHGFPIKVAGWKGPRYRK
jgi:DNA polymerase